LSYPNLQSKHKNDTTDARSPLVHLCEQRTWWCSVTNHNISLRL